MKVIKRDGQLVDFQPEKIKKAIENCFKQVKTTHISFEVWEVVLGELTQQEYDGKKEISVEEIQDLVEKALMSLQEFEAAKAFILYRERHKEATFIRERIDYMDKYASSSDNASTASETDANANVTLKNVANLEGEVYKTTNRLIQRQRMKKKLQEMYPEVASQYINDLDNHIIYVHDEASSPCLKFYCQADSLYPLMTEGCGNMDGVTPSAPDDLRSFSGQVTNLVFLLSAQCKGAVALSEYLIAFSYYAKKDFGDKWWERLDEVKLLPDKTIKHEIRKAMKHFIWGVNQPAGNRSYNSPFSNISIYDHTYFNAMFKDFYFPDGTQAEWDAVNCLQRIFLELHRELRLIKPLTFPVTTFAMVNDGKDIIDKEYKELCAEEWAKGSSFFCYNSDNPTSLASCCFSKDQKVLWKSSTTGVHLTTFEELHNTAWEPDKKNLRVFHNGSWISGKSIKLPNRKMYKVITHNNKEFVMTDNHINITLNGEKQTSQLTTDDYLMFNTIALQSIPELDEHLTYEQGFVVGAFLGDGSFGAEIKGSIYDINFSQNADKYQKLMEMIDIANLQVGGQTKSRLAKIYNNVYPVKLSSKEMAAFIIRWTNWERGTYAYNKKLNLDCLFQSYEFRKGILDGWYNTDGGNSNRCYTTSPELAEDMEVLLTSLGLQSIINISDRTDEKVIIRDQEYDRNYPLYCVRWYELANHRNNKDVEKSWIKRNNSIYFKVKSIEEVDYTDSVYCIECKNTEEPYFTLPSGLITHNCRVLNEMQENTFNSINGLQGVMTGSCNVITLNINRIVQDYFNIDGLATQEDAIAIWKEDDGQVREEFKRYFCNILDRVYKYQIAYKTMLYDVEDQGMFASSNAGYIKMSKLYSTIGLLGYCEAAEFLGMKVNKNEEYIDFLKFILGTVKEQNKLHAIHDKKRPFLFNSEAVPGESLSVKFYNWDKADNYIVPEDQNLYSSYFFKQWDPEISVLDKLYLHGKEIAKYSDGGQAAHIHLDAHLSKEQYLKLLDYSTANGVTYFTFNIPMSECKDCGHVVNAPIQECPICKSKNLDYWVRIIGYLRPLSAYSRDRYIEAQKRIYSKEV